MNLTRFFLNNRPFTWVVTLGLMILGWVSFQRIPRSEDPELHVPAYTVIAVLKGASPTELEQLIARPIEDAIKELDQIQKLQTTIRDGIVSVYTEFSYGVDVERKYDDVQRQVNQVRNSLPTGIQRLEVKRFQITDTALMEIALVSDSASYARMQDLAESLRKRIEAIGGIRKAEKWAYPAKQVQVALDIAALGQHKIGLDQVIQAIQGNNLMIAGGSAELGQRRFSINTTGAYQSLEEIGRTVIDTGSATAVYLKDVADIRWGYEEVEHLGRFNGRRAVFVTALAQPDQSVLPLRDHLQLTLATFQRLLPGDITLESAFDQAKNVEARLSRLNRDFIFAFILVFVTVLPLGARASFLVMLSIPMSLAMGVTALQLSGFGVNQVSIVGCVIALGLLVDDSLVVVENITRYHRNGHSAGLAALEGTRQITAAVVGTTATLLFAFFPLLMLPGGAGQFVRGMPAAVVYTVLASLMVSLTIIPFFASQFFSAHSTSNFLLRFIQKAIHRSYRPILHFAMDRPWLAVSIAGALVVASFGLIPSIGFSLFAASGAPQFAIRIYATEGMSLDGTDRIVRQVEVLLAKDPDIAWWFANVGHGNPQIYYNEIPEETSARIGDIFCCFRTSDTVRNRHACERLRSQVAELSGAEIVVKEFANGPPIEAPIAIRIFTENLDELEKLAAQVEGVLAQTPGTITVKNPVRNRRTDLRVRVNHAAAALLGVSEAEIDRATRLAFAGATVGKFHEPSGDEYNITLGLPHGDRATLENWPRLQVRTSSGHWLPMSQVGELAMESSTPVIQRFNRERSVTVTSYVRPSFNTDRVTRDVVIRLNKLTWPASARFSLGGDAETQQESFGGLAVAALLSTIAILAILTLEFRSFRGAMVVASVIPLGFVGGLAALFLTGYSISFTAATGFVALVGIEIKNSILLVDFMNQLRKEGMPLAHAIESAGEIRFLPVVLTTMTALGALAPLAAADSGLYSPLAIVVMGGLVSSLLLSRIVTPVLYSLLPPPADQSIRVKSDQLVGIE